MRQLVLVIALLLAAPAHAQSTRITGSAKGSTAQANVTATSIDANHTGLDVALQATDTVQSGCVLNAANATCQIALAGKSSAGFIVTAVSAPTGITLVNESSRDGTNWDGHAMEDMDNGDLISSVPNASLAVGYGKTMILGGGVRYARIRASTWTSGSATITVTATDTPSGGNFVGIHNSTRPTYTVCSGALANTAASSALACEAGASKAFRVRALWVPQPGSQTTAGNRLLTFRRTTTAGSAGTTITPQPADPGDAAFSGICRTKGTAGTAGVTLLTRHMWVPTAVANLANPLPIWPPFTVGSGSATTIKDVLVPAGTANGIEVNDAGAAGGANFYICIAVTEE